MCQCARCVCVCALYVYLHAHVSFTWRNVCECVSVCACVRACVFQTTAVFSSSTVNPLSAICPSLKRQLFSEGPLGGKETTGRLHFSFYPHKDVLLLPVLSFYQEVFAVRLLFFPRSAFEILFIHVLSLFLSPTSLLLTDNVDSASLCLSVERLSFSLCSLWCSVVFFSLFNSFRAS